MANIHGNWANIGEIEWTFAPHAAFPGASDALNNTYSDTLDGIDDLFADGATRTQLLATAFNVIRDKITTQMAALAAPGTTADQVRPLVNRFNIMCTRDNTGTVRRLKNTIGVSQALTNAIAHANNDLHLVLGINAIYFDQRVPHLNYLNFDHWGTDEFPAPPAPGAAPPGGAVPAAAAAAAPPAGAATAAPPAVPGAGVAPPAIFNIAGLPHDVQQQVRRYQRIAWHPSVGPMPYLHPSQANQIISWPQHYQASCPASSRPIHRLLLHRDQVQGQAKSL